MWKPLQVLAIGPSWVEAQNPNLCLRLVEPCGSLTALAGKAEIEVPPFAIHVDADHQLWMVPHEQVQKRICSTIGGGDEDCVNQALTRFLQGIPSCVRIPICNVLGGLEIFSGFRP